MDGPGFVQIIPRLSFVLPSGIWKEAPSPELWELCPSQRFFQLNPSHGFPAFPRVFLGTDNLRGRFQESSEVLGLRSQARGSFSKGIWLLGTSRNIPLVLVWGSGSELREALPRTPGDSPGESQMLSLELRIQAQRSFANGSWLLETPRNIPNVPTWGSGSQLN